MLWQLDAGMHTGREGMAAMPYFDDFDLGLVDILLISQYVHPTPLPLLRVFIRQRRMQRGTSGHMGSINHELGATEQVSPKPTVSMLYLRSGQYHAFQSTCSILELLRRHIRSASIVSPSTAIPILDALLTLLCLAVSTSTTPQLYPTFLRRQISVAGSS